MKLIDLTLTAELSQRAILFVCASLVASIIITGFYSIWQWQRDWTLAHQAFTTSSPIKTITSPDIIASITQNHLFGQAAKLGDMPITNLQLRVTGIVKNMANNPTSKAYISISGEASKILRLGERLPDGVKIYDITSDTVILENDGRLEKLPLPREKLKFRNRTG